MSGKKGMIHFSKETKLLAMKMCLEEGKTHRQAAEELGLPHFKLIEHWAHQYRQEGEQAFKRPIGKPDKSPQPSAASLARLEMENTLLKKYHTELRKILLVRRDIGSSNTTEEPIR